MQHGLFQQVVPVASGQYSLNGQIEHPFINTETQDGVTGHTGQLGNIQGTQIVECLPADTQLTIEVFALLRRQNEFRQEGESGPAADVPVNGSKGLVHVPSGGSMGRVSIAHSSSWYSMMILSIRLKRLMASLPRL